MTLGSLFDGIAGFPLAAERQGIKTIWTSEIEANCTDIAKRHFPVHKYPGTAGIMQQYMFYYERMQQGKI